MGAVFTWYVHRPSPTLETYQITKATTGADSVTKGLIPNLTIKIGNEDVPVVYTDVVELSTVRGEYVDSADVAISFPTALHIFGFSATAPSEVHSISCKPAKQALVCRLAPLLVGTKYTVNIAADQGESPTVVTAARNVELVSLDEFVTSESRSWRARLLSKESLALVLMFAIYFALTFAALRQIRRLRARRHRLSFVGRLVDPSGQAIAGATVSVRVGGPDKYVREYAAVMSDSEGDFLINTGQKLEGLQGTIKVERRGYATLEMPFKNPVLFITLSPESPIELSNAR